MTSSAVDRIRPSANTAEHIDCDIAGVHSQQLVREKKTEMKTCPVVDDSSVIRKIARNILQEVDSQVAEAAYGEQAVGALAPKAAATADL
jgi:PleD family two-component response regulator